MPNFLKTIFKPPESKARRSQYPAGPLPPDTEFSPTSPRRGTSDEDIQALAGLLHRQLGASNGKDFLKDLDGQAGGMEKLLEALKGIQAEREDDKVTPFTGSSRSGKVEGAASLLRQARKEKGRARDSEESVGVRSNQDWRKAVEACDAALVVSGQLLKDSMGRGSCRKLLDRIMTLLEAQREELLDIQPYADERRLPTLTTLREIYNKTTSGMQDVKWMKEKTAMETLSTLAQVLEEGPDYLIDVAIIEAVIWQAEVIDPSFAGDIRQVLDQAVAEQADLATFRRAAESIIAIASAVPRDELDDTEAIDAYKAIGLLVKQLQVRATSSGRPTPHSSLQTQTAARPASSDFLPSGVPSPAMGARSPLPQGTPLGSVPASPLVSPSGSRSSSSDRNYASHDTASLQAAYGTGPIPSQSGTRSAVPTSNQPRVPPSPTESEPEVWEYRGNLLTRSALSLVIRQENLAMADSSGQYAGEISWDDLRNAWIPKWAEKLKDTDLADGEVPNTNPAEFAVRVKDAWGNKIGWRDGRMFYQQEPKFELQDDDD